MKQTIKIKCENCGKEIDPKQLQSALGKISTSKKADAARLNGAKGGRPKKKP